VERIEAHIRQVNPRCTVLRVSASSGDGLEAWHQWLREQIAAQRSAAAAADRPRSPALSTAS
jgi:hydrogenase nickel incorporation protein HypB